MKSIIITGASGFIGSHLTKHLSSDYHIIAIVKENSNISSIERYCDIFIYKNMQDLLMFIKSIDFIGVIHLATLYIQKHTDSNIRDLINSNITFGSEICEALANVGFRGWFINVGTFWQFYKNMDSNPLNFYAATKNAFNSILDFYSNTTNITFSTIYLNDTYGPDDTREKIFNLWLRAINNDEQIEMSWGEQLLDMLYIDDVVSAFSILIDILNSSYKSLATNKIFALHTKDRKTLRELAEIFEQVLGKKLNIIWGAKPYMERENFIPFEGGDVLPNWEEKFTFKEGITCMLEGIK